MTVEENEDVVTLDEALEQAENELTEGNEVTESEVSEQQEQEQQEVIEEIEALKANDYMTKEQKELFELLNTVEGGRDHQQMMLDRFGHQQSQYSKVVNDAQQIRSQYEPLNQIIEPFAQEWKMQNGSVQAGLGAVLETYKYATQDPVGFAKYWLEQNGKTFDDIQDSQEYVDPTIAKIQSENTMLKKQFEQFQTQSQRQIEQRQEQQRYEQIESYRQARDSEGNPKFPLLDQVMPSIMQLAQTEPNLTMEQAYGRIIDNLKGHFGGAAKQPQKIVTKAIDKTRAGKNSIKSKNKSGVQAEQSLDQILDEAIAAAQ